ncbi:MAG: DNA methyltransferase [Thaumarchaeota archaeon]|nr:DNA methyltransferase [Nitrososphaerota archaeon]
MILSVSSEYDKLVFPMSSEEYISLKESIKNNGLWIPIICNPDGIILDGHHRFRACVELKIQTKFAVREFDNKLLEKKFVIECNLKRRQLNDFQKTELGISLLEIEQEIAKLRRIEHSKTNDPIGSDEPQGKARDIVAKQIGVSGTTFERARKIIEQAPEEVKKRLRENDIRTSITKEYQNLVKAEKKEKRQEQIKKLQVNLPEKVTLHNSEFQKVFIEGNSVSLIITDPLYHEKDIQLYDDLAVHASRVLREGGSLLCYAGHFAIGRIISMVESHGLKFQWPMAIIHGGPTAAIFGRKVLVGYMPMLWFVKGKYEGEFVKDVVQSEFQGKELHEWAKSTVESDYFIKYMTIENEIVYDPFMGQGTFGVSAVKQNRQFIGCEIDPQHFENAQKIISEASNNGK